MVDLGDITAMDIFRRDIGGQISVSENINTFENLVSSVSIDNDIFELNSILK